MTSRQDEVISRYENLLVEIRKLKERIAELEHLHKNDDCANRMLLGEIERLKK